MYLVANIMRTCPPYCTPATIRGLIWARAVYSAAVYPAGPDPMMIVSRTSFPSSSSPPLCCSESWIRRTFARKTGRTRANLQKTFFGGDDTTADERVRRSIGSYSGYYSTFFKGLSSPQLTQPTPATSTRCCLCRAFRRLQVPKASPAAPWQ